VTGAGVLVVYRDLTELVTHLDDSPIALLEA
jgi:hypothetical protein